MKKRLIIEITSEKEFKFLTSRVMALVNELVNDYSWTELLIKEK